MAEIYNASGQYLGSIRENGEMYDEYGTYMGRIDRDGYIYDSRGTSIGAIWSNGHIYLNGSYVGLIDTEGYVYRGSSYVGHITGYRGAGAEKTASAAPKQENSSAHKSSISYRGFRCRENCIQDRCVYRFFEAFGNAD